MKQQSTYGNKSLELIGINEVVEKQQTNCPKEILALLEQRIDNSSTQYFCTSTSTQYL